MDYIEPIRHLLNHFVSGFCNTMFSYLRQFLTSSSEETTVPPNQPVAVDASTATETNGTKRKASSDLSPRKRSRHATSHDAPNAGEVEAEPVAALCNKFCERYGLKVSLPRFQNVCLYLHVLLDWGYSLSLAETDRFIQEQLHWKPDPDRPSESFHTWYSRMSSQLPDDRSEPPIITLRSLRNIAREKPYTAHFIRIRMETIAKQN
jgi:hypothetical protein